MISQTVGGSWSKKMSICLPPCGPARTSAGGRCTCAVVWWKRNQNSEWAVTSQRATVPMPVFASLRDQAPCLRNSSR